MKRRERKKGYRCNVCGKRNDEVVTAPYRPISVPQRVLWLLTLGALRVNICQSCLSSGLKLCKKDAIRKVVLKK